jgi:hypothetical protein
MDPIDALRLNGRSILLISPRTFSYEKTITEAIAALGGEAAYIDERPGNDFLTKGIVRINSGLIHAKTEKHYKKELEGLDRDIDFSHVLVVSPEALNGKILRDIKKRYPRAMMVLYMWDSVRNKTGFDISALFPYFDRILSFDKDDCTRYPKMIFRPLFYKYSEDALTSGGDGAKYDIAFIGTIHSDRYSICSRVVDIARSMGLSTFFYLYLNDKKLFWMYRALNPGMRGSKLSDFSFVPLPQTEVRTIIHASRCILDIQHPRQLGLTMRTIEVLGAKRKMITTNTHITEYDFFNESNICCIDRKDIEIPREFLSAQYKEIDPSVYEKYSIAGWLREVIP